MPDRAARVERSCNGGLGWRVWQGVGIVSLGGEDEIEIVVELIDEVALGAEIGGKAEPGERKFAKSLGVHGADEALDSRLAEEIDGLARIADEEDGLRVTVPGCSEELKELVLAGGGVLHFVHKQMLETCAQRGGEVFSAGILPQRMAG